MIEYWIDSDSLINPYRGPYNFKYGTKFWDFLESKAKEGIICSPDIVLSMELTSSKPPKEKDELELWAKAQNGILFIPPDSSVQVEFRKVANYVQSNGRYKQQWIASWLTCADPWLIACPMALGGKIVTFEAPAPAGTKPKIPDIAHYFGIDCLTIWDMLVNLDFKN
jgi:hypothetical protein